MSTSVKILKLLAKILKDSEDNVFSPKQISKALNMTPQATVMALKRLEKKGLIKRVIRGAYKLTPKGEKIVKELMGWKNNG